MQSSTKIRPSDILNDFDLNLDKVLNIAVKGTFKPVKKTKLPNILQKQQKSNPEDVKKLVDKINCPFFKQHKDKDNLNCETCEMNEKPQTENKNQQTETQAETQTNMVVGSPEPVVKRKAGRPKKTSNDKKETKKTAKRSTRKTKKETE